MQSLASSTLIINLILSKTPSKTPILGQPKIAYCRNGVLHPRNVEYLKFQSLGTPYKKIADDVLKKFLSLATTLQSFQKRGLRLSTSKIGQKSKEFQSSSCRGFHLHKKSGQII
jgi:hypothetical protein